MTDLQTEDSKMATTTTKEKKIGNRGHLSPDLSTQTVKNSISIFNIKFFRWTIVLKELQPERL
jgi:hypothetical protein